MAGRYLWEMNRTTGAWATVRECLPEEAEQWLAAVQRRDPGGVYCLADRKPAEGERWQVSYRYDDPSPAGPFRGRSVLDHKPAKGDSIWAAFGRATVTRVTRVQPASATT